MYKVLIGCLKLNKGMYIHLNVSYLPLRTLDYNRCNKTQSPCMKQSSYNTVLFNEVFISQNSELWFPKTLLLPLYSMIIYFKGQLTLYLNVYKGTYLKRLKYDPLKLRVEYFYETPIYLARTGRRGLKYG